MVLIPSLIDALNCCIKQTNAFLPAVQILFWYSFHAHLNIRAQSPDQPNPAILHSSEVCAFLPRCRNTVKVVFHEAVQFYKPFAVKTPVQYGRHVEIEKHAVLNDIEVLSLL